MGETSTKMDIMAQADWMRSWDPEWDFATGTYLPPPQAQEGLLRIAGSWWYANANPTRFVDPDGHQPVGADYCRGYSCEDGTRRQFDPLYNMAQAWNEFRESVGMGISIGAANTLLAANSPGHMTPQARAAGACEVEVLDRAASL